ncbi:MAG: hypothetical protein PHN69_04800 [Candidatus Pacebacteria bacterium]|nr:hypothetical protein [Candidatus Paceibacterota bacterium]
MKIFIVCSKRFYDKIPKIKDILEKNSHEVTLPNCFEDPETESRYRNLGEKEHSIWKSKMLNESVSKIENQDAVLVLNFDKGEYKNYIGGATFLEMYDAFRFNKKIFLYNEIPEGILKDEIIGFNPIIINGDLNKIQ